MRVIEPMELAPSMTSGLAAANSGRSSATGASAETCRSRETMTSPTGVREHLSHGSWRRRAVEKVALVDEADDAVALDHRQLHTSAARMRAKAEATVSFGETKISEPSS